ncbi:hypothetical protein BDEG_24590 [Batrachochytrium dendrobatidis JEL423]|uniref:Uncharacterized protein n=1 Tax=Batrachochytrium dendrobatidis (strain JEL423) TaxID=403673 RepID=A0A177WLD0_BATDL|nr:hypothetical protein BDEG_24590 [Batrachochytrium dendrobatidis JEL423]
MNNQLDENTNNVGLYKVNYIMRNEERSMDMLLSTGRKRRNDIKVMIALLMGIRRAEINGVKLRFRKRITCFSSGVEGTIAYLQLIEFQKKERKRLYSRNVETDERMQFYPSVNTSFFNINGHPLVSNTVDGVLEKLGGDDILERLKRPNSKWNIDSIYEYVLLTTPLEEIPIGASITLPDFIKKSKGIFSLENIPNNMCLWYCLARHKFSDLQLDRLATKAKELFKSYYTFKPDQSYCGVEMQELDTIENHFDVNINVYRFNGTKAVMERHSKKTFESTLSLNIYTDVDNKLQKC